MRGPRGAADPVVLSDHQFDRICRRLVAFCGVELSQENRARLARVVSGRMRALDLLDVGDYVRCIEGSDPRGELPALVEHITNHETYFFRESFQLSALSETIVPELLRRRGRRRISFWSAGCSSGEEPLTLAMLLREHPLWDGQLSLADIRILGTDVSRRMIHRARKARYRESAFKGLEPARQREIQRRFFSRDGDHFVVKREIQELVSYLHLNLLDWEGTAVFMDMDVVLCRNVLMYFPEAMRLRALQGIYRKLLPGGYLLLGHSENLLAADTPFETVRLRESLVYRKPASREGLHRRGWSR